MTEDEFNGLLRLQMELEATECPFEIQESLDRYVAHGVRPGDFLSAVLANDLVGAFATADPINTRAMHAIVRHVYQYLPRNCWGSRETIEQWVGWRGLEGSSGR